MRSPLAQPGPRVWAGITAALALDAADPLDGGAVDGGDTLAEAGSHPVDTSARRGRRFRRGVVAIVAAAAVVLLVGGIAVGLLNARSQAKQVATAMLHAFPGWQGDSGTAVLERLPSGREVVQVTTTVAPDGRTDHEVWLMTAGAKRLVSLGLLHGTSGTFTVPPGVDVSRFRLVDVSDEPRDGNPAHSGDSIVRGVLKS